VLPWTALGCAIHPQRISIRPAGESLACLATKSLTASRDERRVSSGLDDSADRFGISPSSLLLLAGQDRPIISAARALRPACVGPLWTLCARQRVVMIGSTLPAGELERIVMVARRMALSHATVSEHERTLHAAPLTNRFACRQSTRMTFWCGTYKVRMVNCTAGTAVPPRRGLCGQCVDKSNHNRLGRSLALPSNCLALPTHCANQSPRPTYQ